MTSADAEGASTTLKDGAQQTELETTHHSGSTSPDIPESADQKRVEAAPNGNARPKFSELFWHHLFLLPVYVAILVGAAGVLTAIALLGWVCVLFWQRVIVIIGGVFITVWATAAWDHFNSHGWQYKPDDLAKLEDEECDKKGLS